MKPACMKNTRNAVTSTQVVLTALTVSLILNAVVCTTDAPAAFEPISVVIQ